MRIAIALIFSPLFLLSPLAAQTSATGTFEGTYSFSYGTNCDNIGNFVYAGGMSGGLIQTGTVLAGLFTAREAKFPFGNTCAPVPIADEIVELIDGRINGSSVTGKLRYGTRTSDWSGTWNGTTLSGTKNGNRLTLTRTSTSGGPLVAFSSNLTALLFLPVSLRWKTIGATSVTIAPRTATTTLPLNGELAVGSAETMVYDFTAAGAEGITTAQTTIKVSRLNEADVVISTSPRGMLQPAGGPAPTDFFTLTNLGGTGTSITLTREGSFFTITPASFALDALTTRTVTIRATTQQAASNEGSVTIAGSGVTSGLSVPIRLRSGAAVPPESVTVTSPQRLDLSAPAGENPSGSVSFTNHGPFVVEGLVVPGEPWIIVSTAALTLAPGETKEVAVAIDRSRRPGSLLGGVKGRISFRYVNTAAGQATVTDLPVTIVDVMKFPISAIAGGLVGDWFLPGASSSPTSFSDVAVTHHSIGPIGLSVAFVPDGVPGSTSAPGLIAPITQGDVILWRRHWSAAFPGVVRNMFDSSPQTGTIHLSGPQIGFASATHTQIQTNGSTSTFTCFRSSARSTIQATSSCRACRRMPPRRPPSACRRSRTARRA